MPDEFDKQADEMSRTWLDRARNAGAKIPVFGHFAILDGLIADALRAEHAKARREALEKAVTLACPQCAGITGYDKNPQLRGSNLIHAYRGMVSDGMPCTASEIRALIDKEGK